MPLLFCSVVAQLIPGAAAPHYQPHHHSSGSLQSRADLPPTFKVTCDVAAFCLAYGHVGILPTFSKWMTFSDPG